MRLVFLLNIVLSCLLSRLCYRTPLTDACLQRGPSLPGSERKHLFLACLQPRLPHLQSTCHQTITTNSHGNRRSLSFASIGIAVTQLFRLNTSIAANPDSAEHTPLAATARLRSVGKPLGATFLGICTFHRNHSFQSDAKHVQRFLYYCSASTATSRANTTLFAASFPRRAAPSSSFRLSPLHSLSQA